MKNDLTIAWLERESRDNWIMIRFFVPDAGLRYPLKMKIAVKVAVFREKYLAAK